jgi:hypothetical protein
MPIPARLGRRETNYRGQITFVSLQKQRQLRSFRLFGHLAILVCPRRANV